MEKYEILLSKMICSTDKHAKLEQAASKTRIKDLASDTLEDCLPAEYLGEGNANLVISIKHKHVIIRFPKSESEDQTEKLKQKLFSIPVYVDKVLSPAFHTNFLVPIQGILALSQDELKLIRQYLGPHRPVSRKHKDIYLPYGLVMPDLTKTSAHFPQLDIKGSWLAVELKPKGGHVIQKDCPHPHYCNFCLKQHYKKRNGAKKSDYCPLDLFSGNHSRIRQALYALLESPQNNIRIFGEGELLHDEINTSSLRCQNYLMDNFGGFSGLVSLLTTALTSKYDEQNRFTILNSQNSEEKVNLNKTCGRSRQQNLDENSTCDNQLISQKPNSEEDKVPSSGTSSVLDAVLRLQRATSLSDLEAKEILDSLIADGLSVDEILDKIIHQDCAHSRHQDSLVKLRDFMLHCTAKDMSIFVMFHKYTSSKEHDIDRENCDKEAAYPRICMEGETYIYSIKVIDLDPKNIGLIEKNIQKKQKWMNSCES